MKLTKIHQTKAWEKKNDKDWQDTSQTRPHAMNIDWLMNDPDAALQLQLSNLIETYGEDLVLTNVRYLTSIRKAG